jgi:hypothetical protein
MLKRLTRMEKKQDEILTLLNEHLILKSNSDSSTNQADFSCLPELPLNTHDGLGELNNLLEDKDISLLFVITKLLYYFIAETVSQVFFSR